MTEKTAPKTDEKDEKKVTIDPILSAKLKIASDLICELFQSCEEMDTWDEYWFAVQTPLTPSGLEYETSSVDPSIRRLVELHRPTPTTVK